MCIVLAPAAMFWAAMAISAASAAATYYGQQQQAKKMQEYQNKQFTDAQTSANASFITQASAENLRLQQEAEKASQDKFNVGIQKEQATSRATVAAGEAGVSGGSVDALLADYARTESRYRDTVDQNFAMDVQQSRLNMDAMSANRQSRVNAYVPAPVNQPSFLGAALRVGGDAFSAYGKYSTKDPTTGEYKLQ